MQNLQLNPYIFKSKQFTPQDLAKLQLVPPSNWLLINKNDQNVLNFIYFVGERNGKPWASLPQSSHHRLWSSQDPPPSISLSPNEPISTRNCKIKVPRKDIVIQIATHKPKLIGSLFFYYNYFFHFILFQ